MAVHLVQLQLRLVALRGRQQSVAHDVPQCLPRGFGLKECLALGVVLEHAGVDEAADRAAGT